MLRHMTPVRTDVSQELSHSIISVTRIATTCYLHSSLHPQSEFNTSFLSHLVFLRSVRRLLVTASVVPCSGLEN
jgi:hypothetical protein